MSKFRFQDLDIWHMSMTLADDLLDVADELHDQHLYRFADQLRGASMSISNNIAEGSGSESSREFAHFLNIARRSTFENANIIMLLYRRGYIDDEECEHMLEELDHLCRKISRLRQSLTRRSV